MWKQLCVAIAVVSATSVTGCVVTPADNHPRYPRAHDQDRDGVRDRYDRDRDGDGVPNWRDRRPDNPRRF
jgi:hypothetical protein